MDIDPILNELDKNKEFQEALKKFALDLFNNNEVPSKQLPEKNFIFQHAINVLRKCISREISKFLDKNSYSGANRLNYSQIQWQFENDINTACRILVIALAEEYTGGNFDYVSELYHNDDTILEKYVLSKDEDHLISLSANTEKMTLRRHAIDMHDGTRIYLHQFLRRNFSGNFVDIPNILIDAIKKGYTVEVRIDPFRIGDMRRYVDIEEHDYWHGKKFNRKVLDDTNKKELQTVYYVPPDDLGTFAQYKTIFRTSMLDAGLRQFSVEEYIPEKNHLEQKMPGYSEARIIQKFAHFVYDQKSKTFEHVDCAVRLIGRMPYDAAFENLLSSGTQRDRRLGKRYKLLKISGNIDLNVIESLLYAFFRDNPNIEEHFSGK